MHIDIRIGFPCPELQGCGGSKVLESCLLFVNFLHTDKLTGV